uniref:SWIB domain-containing protein n=1 Tax=Strongyloides venezuelensis TaxID=75913 RepID=A0A0K0F085_STRVS
MNEMKRKPLDEIFNGPAKKNNIFTFKNKVNKIVEEKNLYIEDQRRASLMIPPYSTDSRGVQGKFGSLIREINEDDYSLGTDDKLSLIDHIFKESIITEWPKEIIEGDRKIEIDCAPLIHKARTVKKCRTQHPTLRVKICGAIKDDTNASTTIKYLKVKLTLRKFKPDERDDSSSPAGHLMLTLREGTSTYRAPPSPLKISEVGGVLECEMKNQNAPDFNHQQFLNSIGFSTSNGTENNFIYENDILTVTFPEIGMKIFSMTDRRALTTRYVLEVDVEMNFVDGHTIKHKVDTKNFLIAITNDQTEALLNSIFWSRLGTPESCTTSRLTEKEDIDPPYIKYGILKIALQNFMKAQVSNARELDKHELLHIQCMLFLPRFVKLTKEEMVEKLKELYTNNFIDNIDMETFNIESVREILLTDFVLDSVSVDKNEFMTNPLVSLTDCSTILEHRLWNWFYRTYEMIADIGHKLCTSTQVIEKKVSKNRRISFNSQSSTSIEDPITMVSLFNQRLITFTSRQHAYDLLNNRTIDPGRGAMMLRFCEDNQGFISFIFDHKDGKPRIGSISCDKIKDNKKGLLGVLMGDDYPKSFEYMLKIEVDNHLSAIKEAKNTLFCQYQSNMNDCNKKIINDQLFTSVNPSSGEEVKLS